jgi:acetoin utilization deacetylase AcuC-like enzyme
LGLDLPIIWSETHREHRPEGEVWVGVRIPGTEHPERVNRILAALLQAGAASPIEAGPLPGRALDRIHSPALLEYLGGAWSAWQQSGHEDDPGQDRVVPYLFPTDGLLDGLAPAEPASAAARAGQFTYDTMTLIGSGTWEAAQAAAAVALDAAELVIDGAPVAYACCRPPGHHATRNAIGGSCYLNNTALAAARLADSGHGPVAVIDIDAHHGNGTQSIFYADPTVLTASLHVDPGHGWFPHFLGFATETGGGPGEGSNRNLPLAPGTGDEGWLEGVTSLIDWAEAGGARSLVLALGVDASQGDPESPLEVTIDGYREAGRMLGAMGLPTVIVQEGGYDLDNVGPLIRETLLGFEGSR